ncbi:kinase-like domain-containing protein [Zychaea mexicana]|uniref:kinase-like domain-containing protein n=1 Tax=Zychaea mexicana TaxID=64656 RepID=UPI0022FE6D6F|nr:kinase-like domain-containing protein [Zychaea mexicana]KAI9489494.1 kinase-like domain-containing protein [Zychaea mexicana]
MASRLVEEERQRKVRLPAYPGLEQYEIIKKLGDGAFSNVYKARDIRTGRKVAIKVVRKHDPDSHLHPSMKKKPRATERANILKEVQIMHNVKHDNIVQLIQFTESKEHYYLVLELCEGGELFHRIVKLTYFSEALARHVITQVAHAVRHLHECGVVHRDIKPENILFDPIAYIPSSPHRRAGHGFDENKEDEGVFVRNVGGGGIGNVKLADFGLSKVIYNSSTWTPCGTVGYTAPEIVRDQRYSKAVDMWALGCVLYTMLCGFPPFYDESIHALTDKVAHGQYAFLSPWWDPISDAAKDLITRLLCIDPNERYTIEQFLEHPWVTEKPLKPSNMPGNGRSSTEFSFQSRVSAATSNSTVSDFDSPQSTGRRKDAFSPGVPSIKEILDITYAVQRMGEERTWRGTSRGGNGSSNTIPNNYPGAFDEGEEDDDDALLAENAERLIAMNKGMQRSNPMTEQQPIRQPPSQQQQQKQKQQKQQQQQQQRQRMKDQVKRHKPAAFELNMDNATILKNRRHPHPPGPAVAC